MHFKLPTTPKTYYGNPGPNDNGTVQVRYESLCVYTSPAIATNLQLFGRCLNDQTMLPDRSHMVTLVLSTRADRPKNAIPRCGVGWQELSAYGDNFGIRGKRSGSSTPAFSPTAGWGQALTRTCTRWSSGSSYQTRTSSERLGTSPPTR